jgi:hypothetical protein
VQFGLQFEPTEGAAAGEQAAPNLPASPAPAALAVPAAAPAQAAPESAAPEQAEEPAKPGEGAEVVRLDRFRKK